MPLRRIIIPGDICGRFSTSYKKTAVRQSFYEFFFIKVMDQMQSADRKQKEIR